jgi:hypothetical protein
VVSLDEYASKIHVGLGYTSKLKPMRLEGGARFGTAQGKLKRIHKIGLRVYKSLNCKVGSKDENLEQREFRTAEDTMDTPVPLFTGDIPKDLPGFSFPSGWGKDGDILIVQDQPLPLTVLAVMPEFVTND